MLHVLMQCVKMQDHHKAVSWWTITGMGSALSARERKDLKPHLQGIEPSSLAAVIWDSINSVGIDDEVEIFGVHYEFSQFARSMRGGWVGYGAGSSFLMDFNLLSHLKLSSRLSIMTYILYSVVYGAIRPLFVRT